MFLNQNSIGESDRSNGTALSKQERKGPEVRFGDLSEGMGHL